MFGKKKKRIADLENLCAEMYVIFGDMAGELGIYEAHEIATVLDKLADASSSVPLNSSFGLLPFSSAEIIKRHAEETHPWGYHAIYDGSRGDKASITNGDTIRSFARVMVREIDMKAYGEPEVIHFAEHDPDKAGYTLIQMIETSAITGHFCDKNGDFYLDIFSCKPFDLKKSTKVVMDFFKPTRLNERFIIRQARTIL